MHIVFVLTTNLTIEFIFSIETKIVQSFVQILDKMSAIFVITGSNNNYQNNKCKLKIKEMKLTCCTYIV